jgi:hypothetical protein
LFFLAITLFSLQFSLKRYYKTAASTLQQNAVDKSAASTSDNGHLEQDRLAAELAESLRTQLEGRRLLLDT